MRKYLFQFGDVVRERTAEKRPIIGKVIGCSSSEEHDFYRIEARGEIYNARDDELELVRRAPSSKIGKPGVVDRFLLNWYAPEQHPAKSETCLVVWRDCDGIRRIDTAERNGDEWEMEVEPGKKLRLGADMFDAWAPWEWPSTARPETGKKGGADDDAGGPADPNG